MKGSIADELAERRAALVEEARKIAETGVRFNRDLSANEQERFERYVEQAQELEHRIKEIRAGERFPHDLRESFEAVTGHPFRSGDQTRDGEAVVEDFRAMLLEGNPKPIILSNKSQRSNYQPGVEARDLSTSSPANMTPVSFYDRIFEHAVASSAVLKAGATVINTDTGEDLRIPRSTARSTAGIVAEGSTIPESDPTLGSVTLKAYKLAFLVTVSHELLKDTGVDLESYLARQAGEAIGYGMNNKILYGAGTTEPTGAVSVMVAGATGPTGTSTSLGTQSTAGQGTDLLANLATSVPAGYLNSGAAAFVLNPSSLGVVSRIKSSTGEPIGPAYVADSPWPYLVDDSVPTMAASAKSILFGDWSRVVVRIAEGIRFERSDHFKFDSDEVTFRAVLRFDSALVNTDAVRYFVNSAS